MCCAHANRFFCEEDMWMYGFDRTFHIAADACEFIYCRQQRRHNAKLFAQHAGWVEAAHNLLRESKSIIFMFCYMYMCVVCMFLDVQVSLLDAVWDLVVYGCSKMKFSEICKRGSTRVLNFSAFLYPLLPYRGRCLMRRWGKFTLSPRIQRCVSLMFFFQCTW